jgi:hypothetical protein
MFGLAAISGYSSRHIVSWDQRFFDPIVVPAGNRRSLSGSMLLLQRKIVI